MSAAGRAALAGLALALVAAAPPTPERWATDPLDRLSPSVEAALDARLALFEARTGHQVLLWIGEAGDTDPETFAVEAFEAWGVGGADRDDGLVLFLLDDLRAARIEVGYGLEGEVPDITAAQILRESVLPALATGAWDQAAATGVDRLLVAIDPEAARATATAPSPAAPAERRPLTLAEQVMIGVAAVGFLALLIWRPHLALWLLWAVMRGMGRGGGGGDGGFRGGDGRSGGGGASGSF